MTDNMMLFHKSLDSNTFVIKSNGVCVCGGKQLVAGLNVPGVVSN